MNIPIEFDPTVTISFLFSLGTIIFTLFKTRSKALDTRFEKQDAKFEAQEERFKEGSRRMDRHDGRIASVEQTVQTMPGKDDIHQLQLGMAKIVGGMDVINATMKGNAKIMGRLETIVSRHEDHLLDGNKS